MAQYTRISYHTVPLPKNEGVTYSLEGAVAGYAVGVQGLRALLARGDEHVQQGTAVWVVATPQLLQAWDLDPETSHFLLQGHIHLGKNKQIKPLSVHDSGQSQETRLTAT